MGKKKLHLVVSSIETFGDGGIPKSKTKFDRHGNEVFTTHYDGKGRPLSGICGDFMTWEMVDAHTIKISGDGKMDNFAANVPPPWQMHEITSVIIEEGVQSIGTHAFTSVHTNMSIESVVIPKSLHHISKDAFSGSLLPNSTIAPYWPDANNSD